MKRLAILFLLIMITGSGGVSANDTNRRIYSTEGDFGDVRLFVQDAIINQGLVIDYNGHVGEMLARTGADVGSSKEIYKDAEYFLFCSAVISRKIMEADPANLSFCPYIVFFYELMKEPGKVYVGYRRPAIVGSEASKKSLTAVDDLLHKIVREATE